MPAPSAPLASFGAVVAQAGAAVGFDAIVEQVRADIVPGITDFNAVVSFSAAFTGVYDNAAARIRWTGARIVFDGSDLHRTAYFGRITEEETLVPGQPRTMRFSPVGHLWTIPGMDYVPPSGTGDLGSPTGSESPPSIGPPDPAAPTPFSPRSWGNKEVELHLSFGASPRTMAEAKLFQGVTLQKSNRGDTAITGDITCVDDSIKYANVPLCYQYPPFGGKRRDEIIRELAANVGVPAKKVFVPVGGIATKPILLSNGSLVPFVNEFGAPEDWFAYFDENGDFRVIEIKLEDVPKWTLDARRGDYDYDEITEQPPSMPPTRYYASGSVPVTGTGTQTTPSVSETRAIYNPLCVKVRPSGLTSYLQPDGSYRSLSVAEEMVVSRVTTEITTVDGRETRRVIKTESYYNPLRYDANFDSDPPGTSYDGAYGDKTFHHAEVESLIETKRETRTSEYDIYGTLQRRVTETMGWYAPKRAGNWSADRQRLTNVPGVCFVFPGGTTRTTAEEQYMVTERIVQQYEFGADGVQLSVDVKTFGWFAAPHWKDLTTGSPDGGGGGGSGDPYIQPPDPPVTDPPIGYSWDFGIVGPTERVLLSPSSARYTFHLSGVGSWDPGYNTLPLTHETWRCYPFLSGGRPVINKPTGEQWLRFPDGNGSVVGETVTTAITLVPQGVEPAILHVTVSLPQPTIVGPFSPPPLTISTVPRGYSIPIIFDAHDTDSSGAYLVDQGSILTGVHTLFLVLNP